MFGHLYTKFQSINKAEDVIMYDKYFFYIQTKYFEYIKNKQVKEYLKNVSIDDFEVKE